MPKKEPELLCKNVFKNVSNEERKLEYTKKWITLINQSERNYNPYTNK